MRKEICFAIVDQNEDIINVFAGLRIYATREEAVKEITYLPAIEGVVYSVKSILITAYKG